LKKTDRRQLLHIYRRLFAAYGPQHWWPAESPFEVMVGAVLTQSARWENVEKAIVNLKNAGMITPAAIRNENAVALAELIRPSGYYHDKAAKLQALVNWLSASCGDNLSLLRPLETDELRRQLLSVHGIGPETADSILLYAVGKPVFVIDAYTRRIAARLGLASECKTYADYQSFFVDNLPLEIQLFNEYHALLVRLAKEHCKTRALCAGCCLSVMCLKVC
jgi:endonuclease-3 related protein